MLIDVARRSGIDIAFCSVDSARNFDVVLVSLTSVYDVLSFYQQVRPHPDWREGYRRFRVLVGGFGCQNPLPMFGFADAFWFGRCENEFVQLLRDHDFEHPSLMRSSEVRMCQINQSNTLYPHAVELKTGINGHDNYQESIMGCPNKCLFCHYSFSRKYIKTSEHYNLSQYGNGHTQELDMFNLDELSPHCAQITIGMDGISERLRFLVNKPISDEKVKDTILRISNETQIKGEAVFLKLYNIIGYESESEEDYEAFKMLFQGLTDRMRKRVIVIVHSTPLHPSPATPLVFSAVNLHTTFGAKRGSVIYDSGGKLLVLHSRYNASNWATMEALVVERYTEQYHALLDLLCFNKKFQSQKADWKIKYVEDKYDITDLTRAYDVEERVPTWFLESYMGWPLIKAMRARMLAKMKEEQ